MEKDQERKIIHLKSLYYKLNLLVYVKAYAPTRTESDRKVEVMWGIAVAIAEAELQIAGFTNRFKLNLFF